MLFLSPATKKKFENELPKLRPSVRAQWAIKFAGPLIIHKPKKNKKPKKLFANFY